MSRPRYSLIGGTLYGNRGAQAMLESVIGRVREMNPEASFEIFSYLPSDDRRILRDPSVRIHSATPVALVCWLAPLSLLYGVLMRLLGARILRLAPEPIRALGESAMLLDVSGVAFVDGRAKFLPFNICNMLPALFLKVPIVRLPQALGPFNNRLNRVCARAFLPWCAFTWARGGTTAKYLQEAKFCGVNFDCSDDLAFCHKEEYALTREGRDHVIALRDFVERHGTTGALRVGVCPSSVVANQSSTLNADYAGTLAKLIMRLLGRGHVVVLFPNATRERSGVTERNNDLPLLRRIAAQAATAAGAERLYVADGDLDAVAIRGILASLDVAFVSRFHAMIGALALNVPTAVIGWSHKYREVMAQFGLEEYVIDYRDLDPAVLAALEDKVLADIEILRSKIRDNLPEVVRRACGAIDSIHCVAQ